MKRLLSLILLCALPALVAAQTSGGRTLTANVPATQLTTLALTAGVGELRITPSSDDVVHLRVTLQQKSHQVLWFFRWQSRATVREIQSAQIQTQQSGGRLNVSLGTTGKLDTNQVKQNWEVQIPARMALSVDMKVGQVNVSGVAGGVKIVLNVGEIDLDTPGGPMSARVNVGQIRAKSGSHQLGTVDLASDIGEAVLFVNGRPVRDSGRHSGLGRRVHVAGSGPDNMNLSVNVGEVNLHISGAAPPATQP